MATVIHEHRDYGGPGYNSGWIIAIVVALLVLVAIFFLWRAGYFGPPATQINIQQPAPAPQTPQTPQTPQAPAAPPVSPAPRAPAVPSTGTTP